MKLYIFVFSVDRIHITEANTIILTYKKMIQARLHADCHSERNWSLQTRVYFNELDTDNDGFITEDELRSVLLINNNNDININNIDNNDISNETFNIIMQSMIFPSNQGNGYISFNEYKKFITPPSRHMKLYQLLPSWCTTNTSSNSSSCCCLSNATNTTQTRDLNRLSERSYKSNDSNTLISPGRLDKPLI